MQLVIGLMLLTYLPGQQDSLRAKLLAEREAAAPEVRSEYQEASAEPDIVRISILTGFLSLLSIAFLFGPAAVISGGMAALQGHTKGLWGVLLGIVGIGGWIAILVFLSRS